MTLEHSARRTQQPTIAHERANKNPDLTNLVNWAPIVGPGVGSGVEITPEELAKVAESPQGWARVAEDQLGSTNLTVKVANPGIETSPQGEPRGLSAAAAPTMIADTRADLVNPQTLALAQALRQTATTLPVLPSSAKVPGTVSLESGQPLTQAMFDFQLNNKGTGRNSDQVVTLGITNPETGQVPFMKGGKKLKLDPGSELIIPKASGNHDESYVSPQNNRIERAILREFETLSKTVSQADRTQILAHLAQEDLPTFLKLTHHLSGQEVIAILASPDVVLKQHAALQLWNIGHPHHELTIKLRQQYPDIFSGTPPNSTKASLKGLERLLQRYLSQSQASTPSTPQDQGFISTVCALWQSQQSRQINFKSSTEGIHPAQKTESAEKQAMDILIDGFSLTTKEFLWFLNHLKKGQAVRALPTQKELGMTDFDQLCLSKIQALVSQMETEKKNKTWYLEKPPNKLAYALQRLMVDPIIGIREQLMIAQALDLELEMIKVAQLLADLRSYGGLEYFRRVGSVERYLDEHPTSIPLDQALDWIRSKNVAPGWATSTQSQLMRQQNVKRLENEAFENRALPYTLWEKIPQQPVIIGGKPAWIQNESDGKEGLSCFICLGDTKIALPFQEISALHEANGQLRFFATTSQGQSLFEYDGQSMKIIGNYSVPILITYSSDKAPRYARFGNEKVTLKSLSYINRKQSSEAVQTISSNNGELLKIHEFRDGRRSYHSIRKTRFGDYYLNSYDDWIFPVQISDLDTRTIIHLEAPIEPQDWDLLAFARDRDWLVYTVQTDPIMHPQVYLQTEVYKSISATTANLNKKKRGQLTVEEIARIQQANEQKRTQRLGRCDRILRQDSELLVFYDDYVGKAIAVDHSGTVYQAPVWLPEEKDLVASQWIWPVLEKGRLKLYRVRQKANTTEVYEENEKKNILSALENFTAFPGRGYYIGGKGDQRSLYGYPNKAIDTQLPKDFQTIDLHPLDPETLLYGLTGEDHTLTLRCNGRTISETFPHGKIEHVENNNDTISVIIAHLNKKNSAELCFSVVQFSKADIAPPGSEYHYLKRKKILLELLASPDLKKMTDLKLLTIDVGTITAWLEETVQVLNEKSQTLNFSFNAQYALEAARRLTPQELFRAVVNLEILLTEPDDTVFGYIWGGTENRGLQNPGLRKKQFSKVQGWINKTANLLYNPDSAAPNQTPAGQPQPQIDGPAPISSSQPPNPTEPSPENKSSTPLSESQQAALEHFDQALPPEVREQIHQLLTQAMYSPLETELSPTDQDLDASQPMAPQDVHSLLPMLQAFRETEWAKTGHDPDLTDKFLREFGRVVAQIHHPQVDGTQIEASYQEALQNLQADPNAEAFRASLSTTTGSVLPKTEEILKKLSKLSPNQLTDMAKSFFLPSHNQSAAPNQTPAGQPQPQIDGPAPISSSQPPNPTEPSPENKSSTPLSESQQAALEHFDQALPPEVREQIHQLLTQAMYSPLETELSPTDQDLDASQPMAPQDVHSLLPMLQAFRETEWAKTGHDPDLTDKFLREFGRVVAQIHHPQVDGTQIEASYQEALQNLQADPNAEAFNTKQIDMFYPGTDHQEMIGVPHTLPELVSRQPVELSPVGSSFATISASPEKHTTASPTTLHIKPALISLVQQGTSEQVNRLIDMVESLRLLTRHDKSQWLTLEVFLRMYSLGENYPWEQSIIKQLCNDSTTLSLTQAEACLPINSHTNLKTCLKSVLQREISQIKELFRGTDSELDFQLLVELYAVRRQYLQLIHGQGTIQDRLYKNKVHSIEEQINNYPISLSTAAKEYEQRLHLKETGA